MKHLKIHFPRMRTALAIFCCLSFVAAVLVYTQHAIAVDQDIVKLNRMVQANKGNTAAMSIFTQGRDLIEAQNWQKAAEKFNEFIKGFPKDKDVDAALYWYAYALQKQGQKDSAALPLRRLIERYPNSSWRREAEALLVTMGFGPIVREVKDNEDCDIKILALQSLFQADEERAISIVTDALKSTSTACPGFQSAAVSLLGSHGGARAVPVLLEVARTSPDLKLRLTAVKRLGEQHNEQVTDELIKLYDSDQTKELRAQILRALVEGGSPKGSAKVIEIARGGNDIALRQYAIRWIAEMRDANSLDELLRLYDTDKTKEIRFQLLRAFGDREDPKARAKLLEVAKSGETPELRIEAIRRLGDRGKLGMDDLLEIWNAGPDPITKQGLLRAFGDSDDARAAAKLFEIAKGTDAPDLRKFAIRQLGNKDDEQTVTQLVTMYDGEQNVEVRSALLRAFGDSKQKVAVRKLMTVARNDASVELRKMAVMYLGQSKDPEALKFLEELLK
ncbi:MAG TPA: HEAT repeat domain-containing protein [Pyrinomonadaceae bacterium]